MQGSRAALVLGHGAGGSVDAPDLKAATAAALEAGLSVALVEQPYRVAGRKSPPRPATLDAAWTVVLDDLRAKEFADLPVIAGGRSSGARVACRTAAATGACAVLCLAFPLVFPGRSESRIDEQEVVDVPTLVVQGISDRFGMPPPRPGRTVARVRGDHGLKADLPAVTEAVSGWLGSLAPVG